MRSSAAKLTLGVAAWIAFVAAAVFILQSEQHLAARRSALRAFDVVARETAASFASLKAAQQGYVAPGQGLGFWMSRVDGLLTTVASRLEELQQVAATAESRKTLLEVNDTLGDLRAIDKRARQYVNTDQSVMAADMVFSEGGDTATLAGRQVETARQAEYLAFDADEAALRRQQVYAAAGATGYAAIAIALLMLLPSPPAAKMPSTAILTQAAQTSEPMSASAPIGSVQGPNLAESPLSHESAQPTVSPDLPRDTVPVLAATAELCAELNRARDIDEISRLLERAAEVLDASGLVVWVGPPGAPMLRPVLAFGYSPQALARMPHVPRTGDNAAAAAFRTGKLQIVLTRPGISAGALAAPMMSPNGCIGALTAEIKNGGETSDGVQALAAIFAAQLGGVLAESVLQSEDLEDDVPASRIASA